MCTISGAVRCMLGLCTVLEPASTEEVDRLRQTIRQLESVAETRAEVLRNLRVTLGLDPDINDEEELV